MRVYLDVNVIIDFILVREPGYESCRKIIGLGGTEEVELLVAPNTFILAFFHFNKEVRDKKEARKRVRMLRKLISGASSHEAIIDKALERTPPGDLEDAYQIELAIESQAELLITSDKKGFRKCPIKVMKPSDFLAAYYPDL